MRSIFRGISIYDVTCNCDLTGSSLFSKHGITKEVVESPNVKERLISFIRLVDVFWVEHPKLNREVLGSFPS